MYSGLYIIYCNFRGTCSLIFSSIAREIKLFIETFKLPFECTPQKDNVYSKETFIFEKKCLPRATPTDK